MQPFRSYTHIEVSLTGISLYWIAGEVAVTNLTSRLSLPDKMRMDGSLAQSPLVMRPWTALVVSSRLCQNEKANAPKVLKPGRHYVMQNKLLGIAFSYDRLNVTVLLIQNEK